MLRTVLGMYIVSSKFPQNACEEIRYTFLNIQSLDLVFPKCTLADNIDIARYGQQTAKTVRQKGTVSDAF